MILPIVLAIVGLLIGAGATYAVLKKGVDGVMIDPFNQLDHLQKPYQREDQYLSEEKTKMPLLLAFTLEL